MVRHYYLFFTAFIAALSGVLFGYDTGVISGAILFIARAFHLSSAENGFVVSAVLIGACIGALCSGRAADHVGRKSMLILDAALFIGGTLVSIFALNIYVLVVGRVLVGIAIGIASYIAPLYISEIAPKQYRGALVSLNQLAIATGIFLSYCVDYHFSHQGEWRWMLGVGLMPAVFLLFGTCCLPYSPRWLALKGKHDHALLILEKLRRCSTTAKNELSEIQAGFSANQSSWRELFYPKTRNILWIAIMLCIMQQVTGINTILYYAPTIFQLSGFAGPESAILASMGIGAVFLLFTILSLFFIDRLGRKPLLYIGLVVMAIGLFLMMDAFHFNTAAIKTKWLLMSGMLIYVMAFAISLGPIMWLMISEIFPVRVRGLGASIATVFNWASNGLVSSTFLICVDSLGKSGTFMIYFVACLVSIVLVALFIPETKQCSLENIERNLFLGKKLRELGG